MSASIDTYRMVNLETASARQVILKLYEAALRNLEESQTALASGRPHEESLGKARTLVGGLMCALNFEAGDISKNLLRLYLFILDRIHATMGTGQDQGLAGAARVLATLKSAWEEMPATDAGENGARPAAALNWRG